MLTKYIAAAMHRATYEILEDDKTYFGSIPDCQGVWANEDTLETCRDELESVLEDWILLGLRLGHTLPVIDEMNLTPDITQPSQEQEVA